MNNRNNMTIGTLALLLLAMLASPAAAGDCFTPHVWVYHDDPGNPEGSDVVRDSNGNPVWGEGTIESSLVQIFMDRDRDGKLTPPDPMNPCRCQDPVNDEYLWYGFMGNCGMSPGEFDFTVGCVNELWSGDYLIVRAWNGSVTPGPGNDWHNPIMGDNCTWLGDSNATILKPGTSKYYGMISGTYDFGPYLEGNKLWNTSIPTPHGICGDTDPIADNVTIKNTNNGKEWEADVNLTTGYYELVLNLNEDVNLSETLEIIGDKALSGYYCPENYTYTTNVTRHVVEDVAGDTIDLDLNHFRINFYPDYQYFIQDASNYSGAAVMQMWADFKDVWYEQNVLQAWGLDNNTQANKDAGVLYVDPEGMAATMIGAVPLPPGHYFDARVRDTFNHAMHETCWWQWTGPGAHPTNGYYAKWMSVRGIHTDKNPHEDGYWGYNITGIWVNDPDSTASSIGANSYKTAEEWNTTHYYAPMDDEINPVWHGKYVTLVEPPPVPDADVGIVPAKPRFIDTITPVMAEKTVKVYAISLPELERITTDDESLRIVQAAIDGVSEELIPFDPAFAAVFARTIPGRPMHVMDGESDYYLVPFNIPLRERPPIKIMPVEIERVKESDGTKLERVERVDDKVIIKPIPELIKVERTLVVVRVDAEDGSFKETSWVDTPVKYLPISKAEAVRLVLGEIDVRSASDILELHPRPRPTIELVQRGSAPYYPDWKITVGDHVFYVNQDGTVSQE